MTAISTRRQQLIDRLEELRSRMDRIEDQLSAPHSTDWEDKAVEEEGDEVLSSLGQTGLQESGMIAAALARIDAGSYGICTRCGTAISDERLDILPFTPFCSECVAAWEEEDST